MPSRGKIWYDPAGAQFRSRDTVFGELMTPVSLNRYTYGWANPLTYWDPDGRFVTSGPLIDGVFGSRAALDKQIAADVRAEGVRRDKVQLQAQERRIRRISEEAFGAPTPRREVQFVVFEIGAIYLPTTSSEGLTEGWGVQLDWFAPGISLNEDSYPISGDPCVGTICSGLVLC